MICNVAQQVVLELHEFTETTPVDCSQFISYRPHPLRVVHLFACGDKYFIVKGQRHSFPIVLSSVQMFACVLVDIPVYEMSCICSDYFDSKLNRSPRRVQMRLSIASDTSWLSGELYSSDARST